MKRLSIILFGLLLLLPASAGAQIIMGQLIGSADFMPADAVAFSRNNNAFTTARVAAMGGAFNSLGGDLAAVNSNPAGVGMFRRSVFGISASVSGATESNSFSSSMDSRTRFGINNFGCAINLYQSSGPLVGVTMAFTYNKSNDMTYRSNFSLGSQSASIADLYANQVRGIYQSALGSSAYPFNNSEIYVNEWGGVLAYQNAIINPTSDNKDCYTYLSNLSQDASVESSIRSNSRGGVHEGGFSIGFNLNNNVYLGFTWGLQDISTSQSYEYYEQYYSNSTDLTGLYYNPTVKVEGWGTDLKLGAIFRPVDGLRLGVAFHTPSLVSIRRTYSVLMQSSFNDGEVVTRPVGSNEGVDVYDYDYTSPARLLLGASYTIGNVVALSLDYDRVWYNGIRLRMDSDSYNDPFKGWVKNDYQAANNFRFGAEVKPVPYLALRCGYAYYGSPVKNGATIFDSPVATDSQNITAGFGFRFLDGASLDFAYINTQTNYTSYNTFYYEGNDNAGTGVIIESNLIDNVKRARNTVTATLTFPF